MFGFFFCVVDMCFGICFLIFFFWCYFIFLYDVDMVGEEDVIEKEKKEIIDKIREVKKVGMSSKEMVYL